MSARPHAADGASARRVPILFHILAACALLLAAGARPARAQSIEPLTLKGVDAELVIGFADLAGQFRRPAGRSLRAFADEFGAFERTAAAWTGLSAALGMEPDEAIDRLLGGRTLLLAEGIGSDELEWALVMTVDREIGRLVPRRLKGAPRAAIDGQTVYSIEDGRFRVACVEPDREGRATILALAHAGAEPLLRAGVVIGASWAEPEGADRGRDAGTVIYRPASGGTIAGAIRETAGGWALECTMSGAATLRAFAPQGDPSDGVSAAVFDAVARRSVVAYAGPAVDPARRAAEGLGVFSPERVIWDLWRFDTPTEFFEKGGAESTIVAIEQSGGGRLDCSLWFDVGDLERAARAGDAYVCRVLGTLTDEYGPGKNAPECTGLDPVAARSLPIALTPGESPFGPALSFSWGPACGGEPRGCGWWGMRVATIEELRAIQRPPSLPAVVEREAAGKGKAERRAMLAQIRPAGLVDMLGAGGEAPGAISALRWIDTVRWEVDRAPRGGAASGVFTVTMNRSP